MRQEPVGIVLRDPDTASVVRERTRLPVLLAADFAELRPCYDELDAKVALYCNNSPSNFDSLLDNRMLHVHINHGESDKQSMSSNNAKSYDRVFVAGQAAVERYASALLEFDTDRLVRIGRPQLDLDARAGADAEPAAHRALRADLGGRRGLQQLLLGRHASGPRSCSQVLAVPDVRVVYKPHPRVVDQCRPRRPLGAPGDPRAGGRGRRPRPGGRAPLTPRRPTSSP